MPRDIRITPVATTATAHVGVDSIEPPSSMMPSPSFWTLCVANCIYSVDCLVLNIYIDNKANVLETREFEVLF